MRTDEFDYRLPPALIAQTPAEPRDSSRLLVVPRGGGAMIHTRFRELPQLLRRGDLLVANDSRVLAARLHGVRLPGGGKVEALLLRPVGDDLSEWQALVRGRVSEGTRLVFSRGPDIAPTTDADREIAPTTDAGPDIAPTADAGPDIAPTTDAGREIAPTTDAVRDIAPTTDADREIAPTTNAGREGTPPQAMARVATLLPDGRRILRFARPVPDILADLGQTPLPPYITSPLTDPERYQTVYARIAGSAAAPTAGLHFTPELMATLAARGVEVTFVTLHVGTDTFRPIDSADIRNHTMHSEWCSVGPGAAAAIAAARGRGGRIIAVGTTTVRALETAALASSAGPLDAFEGWTTLYITPGHRFAAVNGLITNFHLPRSTLLVLVTAFTGLDRIKEAYAAAMREGYRFYSFGDAMLIV